MMGVKSRRILLLAIIAFIALFTLFSLTVGSASLESPWRYVLNPSLEGSQHQIIWDIRFPR